MAYNRTGLARRTRIVQMAIQDKWNRFTWSGLLIILVGIVLITVGLSLRKSFYSTEGLLIGFGAIIVLAGIIRVLIGIINPPTVLALGPTEEVVERVVPRPVVERVVQQRPATLEEALFEKESQIDDVSTP
jgi:protein-S-isoprenylcysteine O-methyltransferase Ste14